MKTCSECKYWNCFGHVLRPEHCACVHFEQKAEPEMKPTRQIRIFAETEQEAIMLDMMQKYEDRLRITSMEYNGLWASFTLSIQDEGDE